MNGALSHITENPIKSTPKNQKFDGDGATLIFNVVEPGKTIKIHGVYVGGQKLTEVTGYAKDDALKRVTLLGIAPDVGQDVVVTYFTDLSVSHSLDVSNLSPTQLAALAEDLAPYLV